MWRMYKWWIGRIVVMRQHLVRTVEIAILGVDVVVQGEDAVDIVVEEIAVITIIIAIIIKIISQ
jgi:hypothetical protein